MNVAPATAAPLGDNQFLALFNQVTDNLTGVEIADRGPLGNGDHRVIGGLPGHLLTHPVLAVLGLKNPVVAKIHQGSQAFIDL